MTKSPAPKPFWHSRTLWVAALTVLIGALESPGAIDLVPEPYEPYLLIFLGALNGLLRALTTTAVTVRRPR